MLGIALFLITGFVSAKQRSPGEDGRASQALASVRSRAGVAKETIAAHGGARIELARLRREASALAKQRSECARELGEAVHAKNTTATKELKQGMKEIDDELAAKEAQMAKVTIDAQERVGKAKLQAQPTQVAANELPDEAPEPAPCPSRSRRRTRGSRLSRRRSRSRIRPRTRATARSCRRSRSRARSSAPVSLRPQNPLKSSDFCIRAGTFCPVTKDFPMPRRLLLFSLVCLIVLMASTSGDRRGPTGSSRSRRRSPRPRSRSRGCSRTSARSRAGSATLESQVGGVSTKLDALEHDLDLQQVRLNRIRRLYQFQTQQLDFFSHEYNVSVERLNARLIEIYESQEEPSTLDVLMSAHSLGDFLEQVDYVRDIGSQDAVISTQVHGAKDRWHAAREKTAVTKKKVETVTRTIAVRTSEVRAEKQRLLISEKGLAAVRGRKKTRLASVQESKAEYLHEVAGLQACEQPGHRAAPVVRLVEL